MSDKSKTLEDNQEDLSPDEVLGDEIVDKKKDEITLKETQYPPHRFTPDLNYVIKLVPEKEQEGQYLGLPSIYPAKYAEAITSGSGWQESLTDSTEEWSRVLEDSITSVISDDGLVPSLEKGDWNTELEHEDKDLTPHAYELGKSSNKKLTGYNASIRAAIAMGEGVPYVMPLWHSGIWVTITPPGELDLIELQVQIEAFNEEIGYATYGTLNSNNTTMIDKLLLEFALNYVITTTKQTAGDTLLSIEDIALNDVRPLIMGVMASCYPDGFEYARSCIADASACNHTEKGLISLRKLFYVNKDALSKKHLSHMASTAKRSMSVEKIESYKSTLTALDVRKIEIPLKNDTAILYLKSPTAAERFESGERWMTFLNKDIVNALGKNYSEKARKAYLLKRAISSNARQYAHYVSKIKYKNSGYIVSDTEEIEDTLNKLSTNDEARGVFITEIINHINHSTISLVAIPVYDCTACGVSQGIRTEEGKNIEISGSTNLIPIDVNMAFIKVIYGRTMLAQMR